MFDRTARTTRVVHGHGLMSETGLRLLDHRIHEIEVMLDHWGLLRHLADPCVFQPPAFWSLLWTVLAAEQRFQVAWTDAWSHEERMTGHFVTTIAEASRELERDFVALDRATRANCQVSIDYLDTATARQERHTGADLGLIVHGREAARGEWLKVARLQVKKTTAFGTLEIDFDQLQTLLATPRLGHYLLFNRNDPASPPPIVTPATDFEFELRQYMEKGRPSAPSGSLGRGTVHPSEFEDWAFWLAFGLADPESGIGVEAPSPSEAVQMLVRRAAPPSRIVMFGLGEAAGAMDWARVVAGFARDQ